MSNQPCNSSSRATRRIQYLIAAVFLVLGGWCVVSPGSVIDLTITAEHRTHTPLAHILVGGFGAQALLAGLLAATTIFTRRTFAAFGAALLPFFVFDYWFYFINPMLTAVGLLDLAGNLAMLLLCYLGWRHAPFVAPDLAEVQRFLEDFRLVCLEEGGRLHGRGLGDAPSRTSPGRVRPRLARRAAETRQATMKRYYFNQRIDGQVVIDPEGHDYPDPTAARASALVSARSLWAAAILDGEDLRGQTIEIANDDGVTIDVVPFDDALPSFLSRPLGSS